ncbi:MAG: trehalose-phosphatase [Terracidiphilus sp.]|jgi:trehalose-phosphatase
MTNEAQAKLDDFFRCFAGAARPALLLDYDGTLAPFRVDRFKAQPWAGVRDLLNRIQSQGRTHLVVVTGRPAQEILPLLQVEPVPEVWGLHGAEQQHPDGRRELDPLSPAARADLDALSEQLKREATGGLIEEKPNAIVMHWRGVSPARAKAIEKRTRALFESVARMDGLNLLEFEAGLELRAGRDKGGAVAAILEETRSPHPHLERRPAAYLGDDLTDESAFGAIKGHGLGVLVRREPRPTAADVWLRPPEELRDFLKMWFHACAHLQSNLYDPLLHSR